MKTSDENNHSHLYPAIAGGISGAVTRLLSQPLDVLKIRFQLQIEPIADNQTSKYRSLAHAILQIGKEEGICAFWKGHVPAQLLSITYGISQFYSYNVLLEQIQNFPLEKWKYSSKFVAGMGAGMIATTVSFPFDTVRTRLVAQSTQHQVYKGIFHCFRSIWYESPKAFFYGLTPTLVQIGPHTGLQFVFYNLVTDMCKRHSKDSNTTVTHSVVAGSVSGLLAKTIIYPLDVSRKRLQIQGFEHGRSGFGKFFKCTGPIDCLRETFAVEGMAGFFKGLVPSQMKAAVTTALYFTFFEQAMILLKTVNGRLL